MGKRVPQLRARRRPLQERSRRTVEVILEAAARVFSELGYANTSTNHIAAQAGVSVGSLYQYFPSKDAVLIALAERHVEYAFAAVLGEVRDKRHAPVPELLRALVDALVQAHGAEPRLHRVIFEEAHLDKAFRERLEQLDARATQLARDLIDERCAELAIANPELASLIVVEILEGLTHSMVIRHPELLGTDEFRDELVCLLHAYLMGDNASRRRVSRTRGERSLKDEQRSRDASHRIRSTRR